MDMFIEGLLLFLSWENFLAIAIGTLVGVIVGAIPGMTGTMGVALALPFTFAMHPVTAILLLVGIYKGALYGGSVSAIMIKTPGTPAAACTILDGYPLARRGEGKKALDMALYASCVADFISNMSLFLFAGVIAGFAIRFGPGEYFALIFFSLTIIAGVSGDSLLKGVLSAGAGLFLATIGLDLVYGTPRLTFGSTEMMRGLDFIPVLIGLFALPEIINHAMVRAGVKSEVSQAGKSGLDWKTFRKSLKTIVRGSLIGVVLGAIPGIGAAPASFLSYSEARRTSPNGDRFGTGELEGIAASESGNNGVAGATLIPLLALGVPGDVITAVILGAFMIHGLTPGPALFQGQLDIIYAIFCGILLSSLCMLVFGKIAIKGFSKISLIRNRILYPSIFLLCIYGTYGINNSMFDVFVMTLMGVFGYIMLVFSVPVAPFLIAFILGPLFEDNWRRSMLVSGGDLSILFRTPIEWVFWILTVISIWAVYRRQRRGSQLKNKNG